MAIHVTPRTLGLALGMLAVTTFSAFADEPSSTALGLAAQVIADIGLKGSVDTLAPGLLVEIVKNISAIHPEMQSALRETAIALEPEFQKSEVGVLDDLAHVLAARMNEDDLRATQSFFESPVGKKYLAAQPLMLKELGISGEVWRAQLNNEMIKRLREEMKKKGYDF
jgi:hypothetical protein